MHVFHKKRWKMSPIYFFPIHLKYSNRMVYLNMRQGEMYSGIDPQFLQLFHWTLVLWNFFGRAHTWILFVCKNFKRVNFILRFCRAKKNIQINNNNALHTFSPHVCFFHVKNSQQSILIYARERKKQNKEFLYSHNLHRVDTNGILTIKMSVTFVFFCSNVRIE